MSKKIFTNIIANWVGYALAAVVGFFLSPFVVHRLGSSVYGFWVLIGSVTGYLGLLELGIRSSIIKYVSEFTARGEDERLNDLLTTAFRCYLVVAGLALALSAVIAVGFDSLFQVEEQYRHTAKYATLAVGLNLALSFPLGMFGAILMGRQRYDLSNLIAIGSLLLRTVLIVALLSQGHGILVLACVLLVCNTLSYVAEAVCARCVQPGLSVFRGRFDRRLAKTIFSYSLSSFLMTLALRVIFLTDPIVIGAFLSVKAITYYAIGSRLIEYLRELVGKMTGVLTPAVSECDARDEQERVRNLLIDSTKYCALIVYPFAFIFIILGEPLVRIWMGSEYVSSAVILTILVLPRFLSGPQSASGAVLYGIGKHRTLAYLATGEALVNLVLSIILVRPYGIVGVALGTAIANGLGAAVVLPFYVSRVTGIKLTHYFRDGFVRPLVSCAPMALVLHVFAHYAPPRSYLELALQLSLCLLVFGGSAAFVCFRAEQRAKWWAAAGRIVAPAPVVGKSVQ